MDGWRGAAPLLPVFDCGILPERRSGCGAGHGARSGILAQLVGKTGSVEMEKDLTKPLARPESDALKPNVMVRSREKQVFFIFLAVKWGRQRPGGFPEHPGTVPSGSGLADEESLKADRD